MILVHKSISLFEKPLFTLIEFETPLAEELPVSSDACFTYFISGDEQQLSAVHNIAAISEHFVLSLCGITLGKMLTEQKGHIKSVIVHFAPDVLRKIYSNEKPLFWNELDKPVTQYIVQMAASNLLRHSIDGIIKLFDNAQAASELILQMKLKEIILLLLQTEDNPHVSKIMRSLFSEKTFTFKETIEAHIFTPASIEDLAKLTNMSLSTFKREFAKTFSQTPASYIAERRLERVAHLLKITDNPVSTLGYECGFATPGHLSRAFKSRYKKTPSQFRLDFLSK
jgi:AraC family transcriptional regulator, exoenzyme S synthesis regulatory protein ExsA